MCGFVGFCGTANHVSRQERRATAEAMREKIRHRGPDSEGLYDDGGLTCGFCRLKIIDLEGGDQPLCSPDGRYMLVFNGEIYNYRELSEQLRTERGVVFSTSSDSEVLLYACICYRERVFSHLRGMYAFAFWDKQEKTLLLARDAFGIKPLFYHTAADGTLVFASEIKAILAYRDYRPVFNERVLPLYLQFQYVPTEETAFAGIFRLPPACYLLWRNGEVQRPRRYFRFAVPRKRGVVRGSFSACYRYRVAARRRECELETVAPIRDAKKAAREILSRVRESVEMHLRSDVPVGCFLSGGVDSGLITALAGPQKAFTVGFFEQGFNEREEAQSLADTVGCRLYTATLTPQRFFDVLPRVQYYSDEPHANLSAVPLYLLAEEASHYVKVVLSGEGADELFGGYAWYGEGRGTRLYRRLPAALRRRIGKLAAACGGKGRLARLLSEGSEALEHTYIGQAKITTVAGAWELLSHELAARLRTSEAPFAASAVTAPYFSQTVGAEPLRRKMHLDMHLWLCGDILLKADRMTMAHSLELRVPYLDRFVYDYAQRLSPCLLYRGKTAKFAFRRAASEVIGRETAFREKKGFPVPFREWIRQPCYAAFLQKTFSGETAARYFNTDHLQKLLRDHMSGRGNFARVLYTVYAFLIWYEQYFPTPCHLSRGVQ